MPAAARRSSEFSAWDRPKEGGEVLHPQFGRDPRPPRGRATAKALAVAVLLSGWFHAALLGGVLAWTWYHQPAADPPKSDITTVDLSTMPALRAKVEDIRKAIAADRAKSALEDPVPTPPLTGAKAQLVELAKSKNPADAPTNARFLSEENHKVAEETVSHDQAMAPKVLADSFKGMGDKPDQGTSKFEGEKGKIGEGSGHDDRNEHLVAGRPDADAAAAATPLPQRAPDVFDPFGIRLKSHEETPAATPQGAVGNSDHSSDKTVAGGGTELAMAGAPSNDYLPNVKLSDKTALNAREFVFASFWHRVQRAVEPFWVKHIHESEGSVGQLQRRDYLTRVDVILNADGSLVSVDITESCGIAGWDRAVTEAFREAAPFVNPPKGMIDPSGLIHMNDLGFIVSLSGGSVVHLYGDPRAGKLFPGVGESYRGP